MTPSRFPNRPQQIDKYNTKKYRRSKFATFIFLLFIVFAIPLPIHCVGQEDDREFYMPTKCESCMVFAAELDADVGRLPPKMRPDEAEAWLLDELEQICERMLAYRVHRDRPGLARFAKQMTGTAKTIKSLKERGVEVKLGVSDELLDRPSIESGRLKEHCEWIQEQFEEDIERWYTTERRNLPISKFLCNGKRFSSEVGIENCANENNMEMGKKEKTVDEL